MSTEEKGPRSNDNDLQDVSGKEISTVPASSFTTEEQEPIEPSEEELVNLRRMGGKVQAAAWLVALFSGAERFAFYALQAPLRKITQHSDR